MALAIKNPLDGASAKCILTCVQILEGPEPFLGFLFGAFSCCFAHAPSVLGLVLSDYTSGCECSSWTDRIWFLHVPKVTIKYLAKLFIYWYFNSLISKKSSRITSEASRGCNGHKKIVGNKKLRYTYCNLSKRKFQLPPSAEEINNNKARNLQSS